MKVLIIANEEWNDYVYGNGVLTNWFTDFNAEFAEIYTSPGLPINSICKKYFQITDSQMAKSIIGGKKAGKVIVKPSGVINIETAKSNARQKGIYGLLKKISMKLHTPVMLLNDFIWMCGHYDTNALYKFVQQFNPDIVFCPRYSNPKLMRLEKLVSKMTKAPFIAFTGDDEVSLTKFTMSLSWLRRWWIHNMFSRHCKIYSHYFMHSKEQAAEYAKEYGLTTSTLFKCGNFSSSFISKKIGNPIRIVYAGRLYCNRWMTLSEIGKALQVINKDDVKMVLDVYTQDNMTREQKLSLSEDKYIYIKGSVTPSELKEVYKKADIALHVESLDEYYRKITRFSFSTKIIDLMSSSCAIFAICWEHHAGYQYLKDKDAAFCCPDYNSILPMLKVICNNPSLITEYQQKAYECGIKNHNRNIIQSQIMSKFRELSTKNRLYF